MVECQEAEQLTGTAAASHVFATTVLTRKAQHFIICKAELERFGKESVCLLGWGRYLLSI